MVGRYKTFFGTTQKNIGSTQAPYLGPKQTFKVSFFLLNKRKVYGKELKSQKTLNTPEGRSVAIMPAISSLSPMTRRLKKKTARMCCVIS